MLKAKGQGKECLWYHGRRCKVRKGREKVSQEVSWKKNHVICRICSENMVSQNIWQHMKDAHPEVWAAEPGNVRTKEDGVLKFNILPKKSLLM